MTSVSKAVIPAAGFGTRFLPFSKAVPKEMIPVVDKPVIQYVVEEAVAAGITDIQIIISAGKQAIQDHFSSNADLEQRLEETGKLDLLEAVRAIHSMADISYVHQHELNGLGHAIYQTKNFVGDCPFAVLLGDTILQAPEESVAAQLVEVYREHACSVVALEEVPMERVSRYGVVDPEPGSCTESAPFKVRGMIEKPSVDEAPSNLVVASRYLFTPDIFDCLERTPRGKGNEIQITDAMQILLKEKTLMGRRITGQRHDVGNAEGFLKTNLLFALNDPELGPAIRSFIKETL